MTTDASKPKAPSKPAKPGKPGLPAKKKSDASQFKVTMKAKMTAFLAALVAAYGEGSVITCKQLNTVWNANRSAYPHVVAVRKNDDYKLGRNQFIVTASANPAEVRNKVRDNLAKLQAAKDSTKLPTEVRKNPAKLLKAIKDASPVETASDSFTDNNNEDSQEDINNVLRTIQN